MRGGGSRFFIMREGTDGRERGTLVVRGGGRGSRLAFPSEEVVSWVKEEEDWEISPLEERRNVSET